MSKPVYKFPKGNDFYKLRSRSGPPPKFTEDELVEHIEGYLKYVNENPIEVEKIIATPSTIEHPDGTIEKLPYTRAIERKKRPFLMCGLAAYLGLSEQAVNNYRKKNPEYSAILKEADSIFRSQKIEGTSAGLFNPLIIMSELGMRNHKDVKKSVIKGEMTAEEREKRIADLMAKAAKQGNEASMDDTDGEDDDI